VSVGNLGLYRPDGRIKGSYVYMLLCRDDGPIYVKVGMTDDLYGRLRSLRNGCPITPRRFCSMEFPSRRWALNAERALQKAFKRWKAHGEWFRILPADKAEFNEAWRTGLTNYVAPEWPNKWEQIAVQPLIAAADQRQRYMARKVMRRGRAYRDACKSGLKVSGHFGT
jgi:predicted GIY-YIG superfamily endonuclease